MHRTGTFWAVIMVLAMPGVAQAYVGPGLGTGTLAVIVGIIGSILVALFAVLWYPLKRLLRKKKQSADETGPDAGA